MESEVAGLRDFLGSELYEWLQDDALDTCDRLLQEASDVYEASDVGTAPALDLNRDRDALAQASPTLISSPTLVLSHAHVSSPTLASVSTSCNRPFAAPKTEEEIEQARLTGVPRKTQKDTEYCVRLWSAWSAHYQAAAGVTIPPLAEIDKSELQRLLTHFILEIRKKDGSEFPPNSLHHLVCGLMRYIRHQGRPELDFFKDSEFTSFRTSLDAEMKRLQSLGIGSKRRQAEILTEEEENVLWERGLLGDASPQALLNTMVFMCGLYFALRSGQEHRQLRFQPCQIQLHEPQGGKPYLQYIEDISKNRPGGLKGRKQKPKVVKHHANTDHPERCFVRLYKLYVQKCPEGRPHDAFYLQPKHVAATDSCWFSARPLGHNSLGKTVARLCKSAGITGFKTNHSLRATAATRLYQSGIDEQLIMERTGHQSSEGVRSYKRTSQQQSEDISDILHCSKRVCTTSHSMVHVGTKESNHQPFPAVPGNFDFHSCNSVTINFN